MKTSTLFILASVGVTAVTAHVAGDSYTHGHSALHSHHRRCYNDPTLIDRYNKWTAKYQRCQIPPGSGPLPDGCPLTEPMPAPCDGRDGAPGPHDNASAPVQPSAQGTGVQTQSYSTSSVASSSVSTSVATSSTATASNPAGTETPGNGAVPNVPFNLQSTTPSKMGFKPVTRGCSGYSRAQCDGKSLCTTIGSVQEPYTTGACTDFGPVPEGQDIAKVALPNWAFKTSMCGKQKVQVTATGPQGQTNTVIATVWENCGPGCDQPNGIDMSMGLTWQLLGATTDVWLVDWKFVD